MGGCVGGVGRWEGVVWRLRWVGWGGRRETTHRSLRNGVKDPGSGVRGPGNGAEPPSSSSSSSSHENFCAVVAVMKVVKVINAPPPPPFLPDSIYPHCYCVGVRNAHVCDCTPFLGLRAGRAKGEIGKRDGMRTQGV